MSREQSNAARLKCPYCRTPIANRHLLFIHMEVCLQKPEETDKQPPVTHRDPLKISTR